MRFRAQPALVVGLVLVVLVGAVGYATYLASTKDAPAQSGTVREGLVVDGPLSLLPPFATTQNARDVSSLLFRGLTRIGPEGQALPELASSWSVDQQVKVYTFHLRPRLQWSDGEPLRAGDAIYTLSVLQSEAVANTPAGLAWEGIKAAAPDATTIVYTLPSASATFLNQASLGIIPQHSLKNLPAQAMAESTDLPSSGPFAVDKVERDTLTLRRNPRSFESAYLDSIEFRLFGAQNVAVDALAADDIDILAGLTPSDADRLKRAPNRRVVSVHSYQYAQLIFNQKQAAMSDIKVRQAISGAIDRRHLIDGPLRGHGQLDNSPIPPAITWAASTDPGPAHDPSAAGRLLDGAGWRLSKTGVRQKDGRDFTVNLVTLDIDLYRELASQVQSDLRAIGIGVNVVANPEEKLYGQVLGNRDFDLALTLVDNGPDPDFYVFWHSSQSGLGGFNFSGMPKDVFLDKDLEDGRTRSDQKVRHDAYADAQKILRDDVAAVFLFSPDLMLGVAARIHGFDLNPAIETSQRYEYAQNWYVSTNRIRR